VADQGDGPQKEEKPAVQEKQNWVPSLAQGLDLTLISNKNEKHKLSFVQKPKYSGAKS